jgi:hypothetical protein
MTCLSLTAWLASRPFCHTPLSGPVEDGDCLSEERLQPAISLWQRGNASRSFSLRRAASRPFPLRTFVFGLDLQAHPETGSATDRRASSFVSSALSMFVIRGSTLLERFLVLLSLPTLAILAV